MAEEEVVEQAPDDETELDATEVVTDAAGNKTVSLTTMLKYKKEARDLKKENARLAPIAARAEDVDRRLEAASPFINAIVSNPRLKAEALRATGHTRPSSERTEQPEDDPEASQWAEINNMYLADGVTLDVARASRAMDLLAGRNGRQINDAMRPLAGVTLGNKAEQHYREVLAAVDDDGVAYCTKESLDEAWAMLPKELLANPQVKDIAMNYAIGLDRRKKRTPEAREEPMFLEHVGGPRKRASGVDSDLKAAGARLGLTEKDLESASRKLEEGIANRRGVTLGGKA